MRVTVLYFGQARDGSGAPTEDFVLPERASVGDLVGRAEIKHPRLRRLIASAQLALNEEITTRDAILGDGDTVAILPPVAGG